MTAIRIRRALISVYDKEGLDRLARTLHEAGVEIVSTGSTAASIQAEGIPVTLVSDVTGFPECLDGRVKTLHPAMHAGLLADPNNPRHAADLERLGISPFQLLVSNLYPFERTVAAGGLPRDCVEQIDIGGPAMVRAAAKNHAHVAVVTSPRQYGDVAAAVAVGGFTLEQRRSLAAKAYVYTAAYDAAVASWFASVYAPDEIARDSGWPEVTAAVWRRARVLRYGENPHQRAALYRRAGSPGPDAGVAAAEQLHGKSMSYNNYTDADAAWRAAGAFERPCVVIIKHSNPCGIALGADVSEAHRKAHACDPVSAYGGVIAANRTITAEFAAQVADIFTEVIVAPGYEDAALAILTARKNLRLLRSDPLPAGRGQAAAGLDWRPISGGLLMQSADLVVEPGDRPAHWQLVAGPAVTEDVLADLEFAWRACRFVTSNAILLASGQATVGVGMGQVNRLDSARLAVSRAGDRAAGSVAASDAFFPFPDGLDVLAKAGVKAVAEPGGSVRDDEVIAAAEAAGISLYFTGVRHFRH
jgi:phosphoribosylaminoimidazolecarboxamide formyltransferase / IMP cyclohydrolase